jgi:hypothetical protein
MGQRRAPGVEHGGEADARAQMLRVGGDGGQRLGCGLEQQIVDDGLVLERDRADRRRQGDSREPAEAPPRALRAIASPPRPDTSGSDGCGRNCRRCVRARSPRSARRVRRAPRSDRSRSPTSPSTGQDSDGQRWPCATPRHGRERRRRPPGEAAPCGVGQAGEDRLVRLRPSRSSGLLMSRIVWTATRV